MTEGLLFIHAFPLDARMWGRQTAALGDRIATVAPDLPGFGGTPGVGDMMSMGAAADRCLRAVDEAGIDRMVVCGLSVGGYVAFELWRLARERVMGFVLAHTKAEQDTSDAADGRRALAARLEAEGMGFFLEEPPALLGDSAPDALRREVLAMISDQPAESIAAAARGMAARADSRPDLTSIDVPTLVLTSDRDVLIPPEVSARLAEGISGAELITFEGPGHLSNLEAPDAFEAALAPFLARCGLPV